MLHACKIRIWLNEILHDCGLERGWSWRYLLHFPLLNWVVDRLFWVGNHFGQDLQHEQKPAWEHEDVLRRVLREREKVFWEVDCASPRHTGGHSRHRLSRQIPGNNQVLTVNEYETNGFYWPSKSSVPKRKRNDSQLEVFLDWISNSCLMQVVILFGIENVED